MHPFSLFSASKAPQKWLCDAICRKKQLFAGSFGSRSHSFCSFTSANQWPMSGMAKIRNWRARHPAWCARCPPERRTRRTERPSGKTIRPGIRACGASLRKSAEPAPPESGTRKKRVEHSTRFRPLKRAKRQKKRLGKKFEKGVVNPFFI